MSVAMSRASFLQPQPYQPPAWAAKLSLLPSEKVSLAMLPTPIHAWHPPGVPDEVELYIKRDDMSGMQLSGNKVRKLEFLMAEARRNGHDSVITIGGIQSNHCRATATAARYLGLDAHLILRNSERGAGEDPGLVGNLLVERLQGCYIHQVTKSEYMALGSEKLGEILRIQLEAEGKRPYVIPVGGSNALGCWGYLQCMQEIAEQSSELGINFTDIAMACGSGATTAGIALGNRLSGYGARVLGYGVCDDSDYFYDFMDGLFAGVCDGATRSVCGADARGMSTMVECKGAGYAISRDVELQTVVDVAMATGVVLDPVYSGKAVHAMLEDMRARPEEWRGRRVLFIHTGGLLGSYDKIPQLQPLVQGMQRATRLKV